MGGGDVAPEVRELREGEYVGWGAGLLVREFGFM